MAQLDKRILVALLLMLVVVPFFSNDYILHILTISCFYIMMACSWNLLAGYSGQFSFAHASISTAGAYASGLFSIHLGLSPFLGLLIGGITGAILGLLLGLITLKMSGNYLALTTLGFSEIFHLFASIEYKITSGNNGLSVPGFFGDTVSKLPYYYLGLGLVILVLLILRKIIYSDIGLTIRAVREDEIGAAVTGVRIFSHKLMIFTLSSFIAGVAGVFLAHYTTLVSPASATISQMGLIITMTVIGGMGTFIGPVIGAILVEITSEYVREFGDYYLIIFGLLLILVLRFAPGGLYGVIARITHLKKNKTGNNVMKIEGTEEV